MSRDACQASNHYLPIQRLLETVAGHAYRNAESAVSWIPQMPPHARFNEAAYGELFFAVRAILILALPGGRANEARGLVAETGNSDLPNYSRTL
jgi:hypothetical protein